MAIIEIESMLPGVIYLSSSPDTPPFKNIGDNVAIGETLALVEVMKSFMPVEAEVAGIFKGYRIESEAGVEAGQVICEIEIAQ